MRRLATVLWVLVLIVPLAVLAGAWCISGLAWRQHVRRVRTGR